MKPFQAEGLYSNLPPEGDILEVLRMIYDEPGTMFSIAGQMIDHVPSIGGDPRGRALGILLAIPKFGHAKSQC